MKTSFFVYKTMNESVTPNSLCRLCANTEFCVDIFGEVGCNQNLYSKIRQCLPIKVTENDDMPTGICLSCITKLNTSYDLHTTSVAVQSKIYKIVCSTKKNKLSTEYEHNYAEGGESVNCSATQSQDQQLAISATYTISEGAEPHIPSTTSPVHNVTNNNKSLKKKRERKTVCQYCRKWFPRALIQHHENLHIKGGVFYSCLNCNNDFRTKQEFSVHRCDETPPSEQRSNCS